MESLQPSPSAPGPKISKVLILLVVLAVLVVGYGVFAKNNNWWSHETKKVEYGTLWGKISYPAEVLPEQNVCAESTDDSRKVFCTTTRTRDFKFDVPVGMYYVYAMMTEEAADQFGSDLRDYKAYYSEFVACSEEDGGPGCEAKGHKKIVVTVTKGTIQEVAPRDWYVQPYDSSLSSSSSDGQTYRNEEYGFELQLPPGWKESPRGPGLLISEDGQYYITFGRLSLNTNAQVLIRQKKYTEYVQQLRYSEDIPMPEEPPKILQVAGADVALEYILDYSGVAIDEPDGVLRELHRDYVQRDERVVFWTAECASGGPADRCPKLSPTQFETFRQILSTFTFTDQSNDTTSWHTYRNDTYGFEVEYLGMITDDAQRYIRMQNYSPHDEHRGLRPGEYYVEISPSDASCPQGLTKVKITKSDTTTFYRGIGEEGVEAGGVGFELCANRGNIWINARATENSQTGTLANKILSSFKFTN